MPTGDGTGPNGLGPMTGRGAGYCAGSHQPGYLNTWGKRNINQGKRTQQWQTLLLAGLVSGGAYIAYKLANRDDKYNK
ncbi:MAG: DUF5320 domain-containing protein [Clostridiales bacterium]|nr:DUF5320 domain-containing protein [Clostridiales bacterium]